MKLTEPINYKTVLTRPLLDIVHKGVLLVALGDIKATVRLMIFFKHQAIVYLSETSSKMASKHFQKWLTIFWQKVKNCVYFETYDFIQTIM